MSEFESVDYVHKSITYTLSHTCPWLCNCSMYLCICKPLKRMEKSLCFVSNFLSSLKANWKQSEQAELSRRRLWGKGGLDADHFHAPQ